jgi:hypothetical protein
VQQQQRQPCWHWQVQQQRRQQQKAAGLVLPGQALLLLLVLLQAVCPCSSLLHARQLCR